MYNLDPKWTEAQGKAITADGSNILVSAGAGSGKTAVLSERVLRKVCDGVDVDRILILTFTKAAAYEMMVRIRKKLIENHQDRQVELIDKAYITTFDSYALSIVNKYHDVLKLNGNVKVIDGNVIEIVKGKILDKIFLEYYEKQDPLFNKLIVDFCQKNDKDLREYILNLNNKLDLKYDKIDYLNKYIDNNYSDTYINKTKEDYIKLLKDEIHKLVEYSNELDLMLDYYDFSGIFDSLEKANTYEEIQDNLNMRLPSLHRGSSDEVKEVKEEMADTFKKLKELVLYDLDYYVSEYLSTKDYVKVIVDIILRLDKEIKEYKYKNNTFEFVDIFKLAIDLVNKDEIREEIANSFDEIMIDEYQDTSDLQELFISKIARNNTYMVGDIKQSIYRFRNANPEIFKNKYLDYEKEIDGIKIDLNKNFRSRGEVLHDINTIFNKVMDLPYGGAEYEKSHQMIFGNNSYIEEGKTDNNYDLDIYNYQVEEDSIYEKFKKGEIEPFIIANDIKEKIKNKYQVFDKDTKTLHDINYSDFVILVDRSTNFNTFKEIFEYLHIPLTIYKDENISDSDEVYIIRNILRLINCVKNDTIDDTFKYSYVSIARSYLFRYSDNDIYDIVTNNKYEDTSIYKTIKDIVDRLELLKSLMIEIKDRFNFDEKVINATNVEIRLSILEYFINLTKDLSELDYDLDMFIDYLDNITKEELEINIPVSVGNNDSVRIMTIHKSKGLEYNICYYAMLASGFNNKEMSNKILFDNKYGIITPSYINGYADTYIKTLVKKKYISEEISEKIRLFYVGLTRCKEKMIVIASMSESESDSINKDKYRSFLDILNSVSREVEDYIIPVDLDKMGISDDYKKKTKADLDKFERKELVVNEYVSKVEEIDEEHFSKTIKKLLTSSEIENMKFGTKIHEVFEFTDFKNPDYTKLSDKEALYVKRFLELDLLKNVKEANVLKEYEFYTELGEHGIIDLMLGYNDHIDIIDYKLNNIDDPNYLKQLSGYKKYIEDKTDKKVDIYLYSILSNSLKKM